MRRRLREGGVAGLHDELRSGRSRTYGDERVDGLINRAPQEKPRDVNAWSMRRMAEAEASRRAPCSGGSRCSGSSRTEARPSSCQHPGLRREGPGRGGPLPEPAEQRDGAVRRREEPDPGARPNPAGAAPGAGPCRGLHPRLCPPRNHDAVRRPGRDDRQGGREVRQAPSLGVPRLPAVDRPGDASRSRPAPGSRQLRHPQVPLGPRVAQPGGALVRRRQPACHQAGIVRQRFPPRPDHRKLHRRLQRDRVPVRLGRDGRFNRRKARKLAQAYLRDGTLATSLARAELRQLLRIRL